MALSISMPSDYGVDATYWKIGSYSEDFKGRAGELVLYGYATLAARQSDKQPIMTAKMQISGASYSEDDTREQLYNKIKLMQEWSGAEDI